MRIYDLPHKRQVALYPMAPEHEDALWVYALPLEVLQPFAEGVAAYLPDGK